MAVNAAAFDPTPPGHGQARDDDRWWGRPVAEFRWQAELARLLVDPVYRGAGITRGRGEPVVLIPGFLAGDGSLRVMRGWLDRMGYDAHAAGILANVDCSDRALNRLDELVERIHRRTGRDVALIGHSRGGHFAKALAHRRPERVSCAISLGAGLDTPFDISVPTRMAIAAFRELHAVTSDRIARNGCFTDTCRCAFARDYAGAFPESIELTSIYSKGDGVVRWRACVVPYARNVEVTGSHVGLAFNRKAYREVARALVRARED
ncbi:MAG: alpha/beta fold hydrolase [Solirubrobacteraceae bacterium]